MDSGLKPRKQQSPTLPTKDPSLSSSLPSASQKHRKNGQHVLNRVDVDREPELSIRKRFCNFLYNKQEKTFCGRTCLNWVYIIAYSIVYLCFLTSYTCFVLFGALWIVRATIDYRASEKISLLTYSEHGIGLSMTPISELYQPLIWYRKDHIEDYEKYVQSLDEFLIKKKRKRNLEVLGPCGVSPYGYASNTPCIVIRINKQLHWAGKPLEMNSSLARIAPIEVQNWTKVDKKLWFHCEGFHAYDREHIGRIRYFPDPPGFDPNVFPLRENTDSPLVAMQISHFTLGVSLSVECKLWYANGPSSVDFMLYVDSDDKSVSNRSNV